MPGPEPVLNRLRWLIQLIHFLQQLVPESLPVLRLAIPGQFLLLVVGLLLTLLFRPVLPPFGCRLTVIQAGFWLLAFEVVTVISVGLLTRLFGRIEIPEHFKKLAEALRQSRPLDLVFTSMLAGFAEEFLFRAVLASIFGVIPSAILFALAHMPRSWLHGLILAGLGILFSYEVALSGGLLLPMAHHAIHDVMILTVLHHTLKKDPRAFDRSE